MVFMSSSCSLQDPERVEVDEPFDALSEIAGGPAETTGAYV